MEIPSQLLQFGGSLVAITLLAVLARALGLGKSIKIEDEDQASQAAKEVLDGFDPFEITLDVGGVAALLRDKTNKTILIKQHGNKLAGRILDGRAWAEEYDKGLIVDCGDARFGAVTIQCSESASWVETINAIG